MIKSVSLRNLVLFIRVMLWGRARSWYEVTVCWGRYGWGTPCHHEKMPTKQRKDGICVKHNMCTPSVPKFGISYI